MFHNFQVPSFDTDAIFVESEENEKCNTPEKRGKGMQGGHERGIWNYYSRVEWLIQMQK